MTDPDATVSVCIPIYNGARFLRECLDSVLAQTRRPDEIVIVDDGSTDDGPSIVEHYRTREPRIRFVVNPRNLGLVGNWNRCIDLVSSTWIKFVFQDDLLLPGCLAAMMARTDASTDIVACRRDFVFDSPPTDEVAEFYAASQRLIDTTFDGRTRIDAETARSFALEQFGHNLLGEPSSVLLRKDCFERFGRFREGLVMSCDLEYWIRVAINSGASYVPETLSRFRVHAGATSADNRGRRAFRMWSLDNLLLLRDYTREPVYRPLREHAARRRPPIDLDGWLRQRRHEVYATAESAHDGTLASELAAFYADFPDVAVTPQAHWMWRLKRKLRGALAESGA